MKLYSRGQVIFFSLASACIVFLLALGFGLLSFLKPDDNSTVSDAVEVVQDGVAQKFQLETNPPVSEDIIPARSGNGYGEEELENIGIYERLNRGVVNITTQTLGMNWFLEPVPLEGGTGSGSIIDARGYVITNNHVVENAYKVYLNLYDGTQFEGEVIGKDPENDLAVVQFDPKGKELVTIPFGNSDDLRVGQKVLAIGNPFGYDRTLTTGIVSGIGRPVKTSNNLVIHDMIQTDASINPGNSGGPLIDSQGQMIGINTMIYSPTGGSVGIGFAVPIATARRVVPDLIEFGIVQRGWIDIIPVQLEPNIVRYGRLPVDKGILVSKVVKGGNAEQAGIQGGDTANPVRYGRSIIYFGGDVIVEVDGAEVISLSDLFSALEDTKPGDIVNVSVLRGRQKKTFQIELSERPDGLSWD